MTDAMRVPESGRVFLLVFIRLETESTAPPPPPPPPPPTLLGNKVLAGRSEGGRKDLRLCFLNCLHTNRLLSGERRPSHCCAKGGKKYFLTFGPNDYRQNAAGCEKTLNIRYQGAPGVRQPVRVGSRRFRGSETWNLGGKRLSFWFELYIN